MGLLDDAIREHLALKRRRGADPGEIAREEDEALGPVRRDAPVDVATQEPPGPYADEPAGLEDPGVAYAEEPAPEPEPERYASGTPLPADPPRAHHEPFPETEAESATPPHGDPLLDQHTREFSAHELDEALGAPTPPHGDPAAPREQDERGAAPAGDAGEGEEDVLEETPDFLQETPEHERLWFEQKPPKDFDF